MRLLILLCCVSFKMLSQKELPLTTSDRRDKLDTILLQPRITNADTLIRLVERAYLKNVETARLHMQFKYESTVIVQPQTVDLELERTPSTKTRKNEINKRLLGLSNELIKKPIKDYKQCTGLYNGNFEMGLFMNVNSAYTFKNFASYTVVDDLIPKLEHALGGELSQIDNYKVRSGILPIDSNFKLVIDTATVRTYKDKDGKEHTYSRDLRSHLLGTINRLISGTSYEHGNRKDLLNLAHYKYDITDFVQTDSTSYYKVFFTAANRKGTFEGTMQINASDFGITHLKYGYAPGKHGQQVNLKWLLGVKFSQPVNTEEVVFNKHESGAYYPTAIKQYTWSKMYIHRPFQLKNLKNKNRYRFDVKGDAFVLTYDNLYITDVVEKEKSNKLELLGVKKYTTLDAQN